MNEETGLPEVPEGYFWRVTEYDNLFSGTTDVVELRRKTWIGSKRIAWKDVGYPSERNIQIAAEEIMESFEWDREREEDRARLQGDYPPKRLS